MTRIAKGDAAASADFILRVPTARPVDFWALFKATRAGRRDRKSFFIDESGRAPYIAYLEGITAISEATVGQALYGAVSKLDQEFVSLCAAIAQHRQKLTRAAPNSDDASPNAPTLMLPYTIRTATIARRHALVDLQLQNDTQRIAELIELLPAKLVARRYLIDRARAIVAGYIGRFSSLAAAHSRGLLTPTRRGASPRGHLTNISLPHYTPISPWMNGDLPILVARIDFATQEVITWAVQKFDRSDSSKL
ncbi:hypothetical protein [Jatrophihabitans sp.]|uniref:hypothetical protein n=1 Tax=Jatrophihabitans sp. TaxID=1932789 RepID=UPI002C896F8B|nr:hypothetical protein [Jatrophihabitans sp.]